VSNPMYILPFAKVGRENLNQVGGKGANLGELIKAGFRVPFGFCISVNAYQRILSNNDLQHEIKRIISTIEWEQAVDIEAKSSEIRALIEAQAIPPQVAEEVQAAYVQLSEQEPSDEPAVAVRSSATAEDLPNASFAGQQETYLNIKGIDDVLLHVRKCWASLWTARAMSYRNQQGYSHEDVFLSVVVQKMVEAEVAGVAFSINPLTEDVNQLYITSAYGLGEVVVAGSVTPDSFVLRKKDFSILRKEKGSKERELILGDRGHTVLRDVDISRRNTFSLSNNQLKQLGQLISQVEKYYGVPQDIEWAWAKGEIYLLQTRPITTLGRKTQETLILGKASRLQRFIIDDLIEHYPEAPTTLDHAVVTISYQALLNRVINWGLRGPAAKEIIYLEHDGRIRLIPPKVRLTLKLANSFRIMLKQNKNYEAYALEWSKIGREVQSKVAYFETLNWGTVPDKELRQYFAQIFALAERVSERRFFYVMDLNILPMSGLSLVLKLFSRKDQSPMAIDLITTGLDYRTAVIDRALNRLALLAERSSFIKALILERAPEDWKNSFELLNQSETGRVFLEQLNLFLAEHGYRTEKTYQPFNSESWKEDPGRLLVALRAALQDTSLRERETKETERNKEHQKWLEGFQARLKGNWKKLFQWSYQQCRENHILREDTLFEFERIFVAGRMIAREIGERLTQAELLTQPNEIVYLTREEISEILLAMADNEMKIRELVLKRRRNHSINQALWRNTLIQTASKYTGEGLKGQSGSPGLAEGPARIIRSAEEFGELRKGEIIVCPYTDPSWTPLFVLASAVVADTGGPLSHAAIVAREYGIPAVLGTKIGTENFKNGERLIVDGTKGIVISKGL